MSQTFNPPVDSFRESPNVDDPKHFRLGALSAIPRLEDIGNYSLPKPLKVLDQTLKSQTNDFCSAFAVAQELSYSEGDVLFPNYSFAASKEISKDPQEWGQNLESAMRAPVKYGIPFEKDVPDSIKNLSDSDARVFKYYESLKEKAFPQRQKTYWKTSGPYEPYDNVRAWIFKHKKPVVTGLYFGWSLQDRELTGTPQGFGHAMCYTLKEGALYAINSAGEAAGDGGMHKVSRETANHYIMKFDAMMHMDIPKEEALASMDMYYSSKTPWWKKIIIRMWT